MYYIITTDNKYAFDLEKYETIEEATKALENYPWNYDYRAIIKGDMIFETED